LGIRSNLLTSVYLLRSDFRSTEPRRKRSLASHGRHNSCRTSSAGLSSRSHLIDHLPKQIGQRPGEEFDFGDRPRPHPMNATLINQLRELRLDPLRPSSHDSPAAIRNVMPAGGAIRSKDRKSAAFFGSHSLRTCSSTEIPLSVVDDRGFFSGVFGSYTRSTR
jgi:hypothetical protein